MKRLENQIASIKAKLLAIGDMRPGSLTKQYKNPKEKTGGFYQLSYTYQMKSKTEYVQPRFVPEIKKMTANFKQFKQLTQKWLDLAFRLSKLKMQLAKEKSAE